jgi:hypothetical protein
MAENYNYFADARRRWPKADIDGNGPHVCFVLNFDGSIWIRLFQAWGDAQQMAEKNGGQCLRLKPAAPVRADLNSDFGYRERNTVSA